MKHNDPGIWRARLECGISGHVFDGSVIDHDGRTLCWRCGDPEPIPTPGDADDDARANSERNET
jgi:hypothetical protein